MPQSKLSPSLYYHQSIENNKRFHSLQKGWAGYDSKKYHQYIRDLVIKYSAIDMLDYGSGRGNQYQEAVYYPHADGSNKRIGPFTFDQVIGIQNYTLYDPCVVNNRNVCSVLPARTFDCVICTQVLGAVPDIDLPMVIQHLADAATKFCFIGLIDPELDSAKSAKFEAHDVNHFIDLRTKDYYNQKFAVHWRGGADLFVFYKSTVPYHQDWLKSTDKSFYKLSKNK